MEWWEGRPEPLDWVERSAIWLTRKLEALRGKSMSGIDRASVVGVPVWPEGDDETDYNRVIFAYLGETDGTHYYSVQDAQGVKIYPAERLRVMTADGLAPLPDILGAISSALRGIPGPVRAALTGTETHPFEQIGRAGNAPNPSVQVPAEGTQVPVFAADDFDRYQRFLAWEKSQPSDPGDMQTTRPLSPAEAANADRGALEASAADAADRDQALLGPARQEREIRALETLNDPAINQRLQAGETAFPPVSGWDAQAAFAEDASKIADIPATTAPGDEPAPSRTGEAQRQAAEDLGRARDAIDGGAVNPANAPAPRLPKEDTTAEDTSTNGGNSPTSAATSGDSSGVVGGTVDPADAPGTREWNAAHVVDSPEYKAAHADPTTSDSPPRSGKLGGKGKK